MFAIDDGAAQTATAQTEIGPTVKLKQNIRRRSCSIHNHEQTLRLKPSGSPPTAASSGVVIGPGSDETRWRSRSGRPTGPAQYGPVNKDHSDDLIMLTGPLQCREEILRDRVLERGHGERVAVRRPPQFRRTHLIEGLFGTEGKRPQGS